MDIKILFLSLTSLIMGLIVACSGDSATAIPTSTPFPIPTKPTVPPPTLFVPSYTVSGTVLSGSNSYLLGGTLTMEPSGMTANTDLTFGEYEFTDVPDGVYTVTVSPACVAYGCFIPKELVVEGGDVRELDIAPFVASLLKGGPSAARTIEATGSHILSLDEIEFASTSVILVGPNDMEPGDSVRLVVGAPSCLRCADLLEVVAPTVWSVSPAVGASIDVETGVLSISTAASFGSTYTVTANLGEFAVSKTINIYSAEENPLVGVWAELNTGNVNTLLLTSDGEFAVTLNPYGNYQDFWGDYTFDQGTGVLRLQIQSWNQAPPDVDGIGTFFIDAGGQLSLVNICLGEWHAALQSLVKNCDHIFGKYHFNLKSVE